MPIYSYECEDCKYTSDEYQKMTSLPLVRCPLCISDGYHRVPTLYHTDLKEFHTPISMMSVACDTDEEIRRVQRQTGVEISSDPNDPDYGIPKAKNRKEKLAVLKAQKFVESN